MNPLAALSFLRPRLILPYVRVLPISCLASIRGTVAGLYPPPQRSPSCTYSTCQHVSVQLGILSGCRAIAANCFLLELCAFSRPGLSPVAGDGTSKQSPAGGSTAVYVYQHVPVSTLVCHRLMAMHGWTSSMDVCRAMATYIIDFWSMMCLYSSCSSMDVCRAMGTYIIDFWSMVGLYSSCSWPTGDGTPVTSQPVTTKVPNESARLGVRRCMMWHEFYDGLIPTVVVACS